MAKKEYMTLEDIEKIPREFLVPREVAAVLGCATYFINLMAKQNPEALGFPVIFAGRNCKILKRPFLKYMRGDNAKVYGDKGGDTNDT